MLFTDAFHARIDVPEAVAQAADSSGIELVLAPILGTGDDVVAVVADRLSAAGTTATEPILLYAVGSSRPDANAAVADLADRLAAHRGTPVRAGFGTTEPRAADVLAELVASTDRPGTVVPLFVAPGLLLDGIAPAVAAAGWRLADPLGTLLASVVSQRYHRGTGYRGPPPLALGHGEAPPMTITADHAGRRYPPTPAYEVSAAKIAEFARALGDDSPAYAGEQPIAPPTFVAVISSAAWESMFDDPELGLALRRIVHGDQRFTYRRPLRAGDRVQATLTIDKVRNRGAADIISSSVEVETVAGELICTAEATFFHSHEADA